MFGLLVGYASFSANAKWGSEYLLQGWNKAKEAGSFVITPQKWNDNKLYFTLGTLATAGITAGAAYLIYKKIEQKKAKAKLAIAE